MKSAYVLHRLSSNPDKFLQLDTVLVNHYLQPCPRRR
jgi:hypothetical protein